MKKSLNTFFLMTILVFCMFLYQIWLKKTVFWTNIEINVFFNPKFNYLLMTTCAFCLINKYRNVLKKHFS